MMFNKIIYICANAVIIRRDQSTIFSFLIIILFLFSTFLLISVLFLSMSVESLIYFYKDIDVYSFIVKDYSLEYNVSILGFPIITYSNSDTLKLSILDDNKNKTGIYRWTHISSGKSYIGSAINLHKRFKNYYNISYLEREIKINSSMIYRAILKYGYSEFSLDILEYCDIYSLVEKEQHYLNTLKPEYNIMKHAGSVLGLKHTEASIELIRAANIGRVHTEKARFNIATNSATAISVMVKNIKTGESKEFISIRSAARYAGLHHSFIAKCLQKNNVYRGKNYIITKQGI